MCRCLPVFALASSKISMACGWTCWGPASGEEAGFEQRGRPCVLLLHGFPELAYSWRKVMVPLASAGFHVVAPDQRGYGRTIGWEGRHDGGIGSFRLPDMSWR